MLRRSLALIVGGECVLRYDNERGKGDHRHFRDQESTYAFVSVEKLMDDVTSANLRGVCR